MQPPATGTPGSFGGDGDSEGPRCCDKENSHGESPKEVYPGYVSEGERRFLISKLGPKG